MIPWYITLWFGFSCGFIAGLYVMQRRELLGKAEELRERCRAAEIDAFIENGNKNPLPEIVCIPRIVVDAATRKDVEALIKAQLPSTTPLTLVVDRKRRKA